MKLLLILRPVPKGLFFQIRDIVNNIPMIRNVNENNSTVVFLESSDMGKKYIVFYDKKEHKAYKLFWKIITDIVSDEYVKYWSKKDLIEIGNYTKEKNNILTIYFEFNNSDYSLLDKQSIYKNLLCQIENAKLSKKDEDILNIPALKKLKKCLKEYNKTISQIDELLQSSCYISITSQMDDFVKNRKSFLQEKSNINKIMSKVNQLEGDPIENNKLLSKLIHLKELIDEISKNLSILEKRMSRLEKSDLSETEKRILSEAGKLETIENGFLEYDDNLIKIVDLDSLDYSDLERILKNVSDSIYDLFYEYETYIIHKNIGWQQLCSEYVYRDFNTISKLDLNGIKFDITGQYEMLKKYLNATDKDTFPLLLFAYMLFAINKSLFNSPGKKFAVNIINPYNIEANETLIEYILRLNMNFTNLGVYLNNNFLRDFNKEFQIPSNFINPLCLKSTRYKLQDFPVFLYKLNPKKKTPKLSVASNYKNKKIKIKRVISDSVLQKELKSQISYIFLTVSQSGYLRFKSSFFPLLHSDSSVLPI